MASDGVIKFELDYTEGKLPIKYEEISRLNEWRDRLVYGKVVGEENGIGFGNLSQRVGDSFIITGSQTGGLAKLTEKHFCVVKYCDPEKNYVLAEGPIKPSSEAMSHDVVYRANPAIHAIAHVHSRIWKYAQALGIPTVSEELEYGTSEMAAAIEEIVVRNDDYRVKQILSMGEGHPGGIIAWGDNINIAGDIIGFWHFKSKLPKHLTE